MEALMEFFSVCGHRTDGRAKKQMREEAQVAGNEERFQQSITIFAPPHTATKCKNLLWHLLD
jgi:hypothetical protein